MDTVGVIIFCSAWTLWGLSLSVLRGYSGGCRMFRVETVGPTVSMRNRKSVPRGHCGGFRCLAGFRLTCAVGECVGYTDWRIG